jgi:DNA-binding SARP family transcriptional activator
MSDSRLSGANLTFCTTDDDTDLFTQFTAVMRERYGTIAAPKAYRVRAARQPLGQRCRACDDREGRSRNCGGDGTGLMDFRILGPLEVHDGDRLVRFSRPKHRALLAALLLSAGRVVSVDHLLDDLWGERSPPTAKESLQNGICALRKVLGAQALRRRPPGYLLDVEPDQVDVFRFERLLEEAGAATGGEERAEKLRQAIALWRGPALADLAFQPIALLESPRLEDLRLAAHEELIDAELSLGAGAELVGGLESLIVEHPFRERLRGQLMLALYRSGRQAEALETYQETRRTLANELGIGPSVALRELEQAILRQDAPLLVSPGIGHPAIEGHSSSLSQSDAFWGA